MKARRHNDCFAGGVYQQAHGRACERCGRVREAGDLNYEALSHHNAVMLECIDRKSCERARRKRK